MSPTVPFSKDALLFTKQFHQALHQQVEELTLVSLKPLEIVVQHQGNKYTHFLNNFYLDYQRAECLEEQQELLQKRLNMAVNLCQPTPDFDYSNIVPIVKDLRYINHVKELCQPKPLPLYYESYNEWLYILYAQDRKERISYLTPQDITNHQIDTSKLRALGLKNLLERLTNIEMHGDYGLFLLTAGGNYEASFILNDAFWAKDFPVDGEVVIGIPSRDVLIISGTQEQENLALLKDKVATISASNNYLITDQLFVYRNGIFEVYQD